MKTRIVAALTLCAALLTGCGEGGLAADYRNIAALLTVQVIGVDCSENGVVLSVCASGGDEDAPSVCLSCEAESIAAAREKLGSLAEGMELFFGHTAYCVLGKSVLEDGVPAVLDCIERDTSLRLNTPVFAVPDGQAGELLLGAGGDGGAAKLLQALTDAARKTGSPVIFTALRLASDFGENGAGLICAVKGVPTAEGEAGNGLAVVPDGYIIINNGKAAGRVPEEASGAVSLLLGESAAQTVTLGAAAVRLEKSEREISPVFAESGLTGLDVSVSLSAALLETDGAESASELEARLCEDVRESILSVLDLSRQTRCDFLHLGAALEMREGSRLRGAGEYFGASIDELEISAEVNAEITHSFLIALEEGEKR